MKTCENCGIEFEPAKPWQRFHSPACKVRAFRAAEAAQSPTRPVEQVLQDALAAVRAKGSDPAAVVAELRGRLDALYPPPAPVRPEPEPVKATKGRAAKGKATKPKPAPRFKVSREPVQVSRAAPQSRDDALRARLRAARAAGHGQNAIAIAIGFADGSTLSRWASGSPRGKLSDEKAEALATWLTSQGC